MWTQYQRATLRWALAALCAYFVLLAVGATLASGYTSQLRRYPYLTDVVGSSATVNWATNTSGTTGSVKWGPVGSCTANTATATRTSITVNSVSEYQWKASFTVSPNTQYCYRVYLGTTDLLGTDASPTFYSQLPAGSSQSFSFAVFGDWGDTGSVVGSNPEQANLMQQIASSGVRFAVTTGDNSYPSGSQTNYGDLVQSGQDISGVFGPSFWTVPGRSIPIYPTTGNHGFTTGDVHLLNFPQTQAVASSNGRYVFENYCCLNGTTAHNYPSAWYAFDAGNSRFYLLSAAWANSNVGNADLYKNDYDYHWTPTSPEYVWLQNDLATHASVHKFAFWHFPLYSDQSSETSDPWLRSAAPPQAPSSLEGLLKTYGVDIGFTGHAHIYERNIAPNGNSVISPVTGGGGADSESIGGTCSSFDAYGIGWSDTSNTGNKCGSAPVPTSRAQVVHFLKVTVNGAQVTVTPTNSLGQTFDQITYTSPTTADLALTKSDAPDPVLAGQNLTYSLTAANNGPSSASGVTITDTLPSGVTFVSASASQGSCSQSSGTVTCNLGSIANSNSANATITVRPQTAGTITNNASVTSSTSDPTSSNNSASAQTTVNPAADLALTKTDSPDPVLAGQPLTYTLTATNNGPSSATGTTVTDTLPSGVTFSSASASQGSCSQASGTVTCSLGTVANGGSATATITVQPQSAGTITNNASVSSGVSDPTSSNNSASAATTVNPAADLSLTKTDSPDPVLVGQTLTYTLTAANNGPSSATGTTITDTLPSGVTFNSASATQGTCSQASGTVTCSLGTLASGGSATATITVQPQSAGSLTNNATVASSVSDPTSSNNTASATTTVSPVADLSLTKSDSPDPVLVGQPLTYTLTAQNAGPSGASGTTITDTLPTGVTFSSASASQGSCTQSSGTVTCNLGTLVSGAFATATITVRPQNTGTITNNANVSSSASDPVSTNNSATAQTTVNPAADLSLTKSDSPDPVLAGQLLTYTLTATNNGPSSATGTSITDALPSGLTFDSASASQGSCTESSGTVTCNLGTLGGGASATATITVRPQSAGTITNNASVTSSTSDPVSANNNASVATTVNPAADLSLTKTDSPDPVPLGQLLTYTLTATNNGPSSASGVTISDTFPNGVDFDSVTASQGTCSRQGQSRNVDCNIGTLASGSTAIATIKVRPQNLGTITNSASVTSGTTDPVTANNSASAQTTVTPAVDMALTKSDSPDPVLAGQPLTYTLTAANNGPSSATGVTVTDTLPNGVIFDSASASQGVCSESSGIVTCNIGTLANGASATAAIVVHDQDGGSITNSAGVQANEADVDMTNNTASAQTSVTAVADLSVGESDDPDPVLAGEPLTYTVTGTNNGPSGATGVTLTDTLPSGVTFESATASQGTCSETSGIVTCNIGTVASGASATATITVRPQAEGTITNTVSVGGDQTDPDSQNNQASEQTTVDPATDLAVVQSDSPDPVPANGLLTYTVIATNEGPSNASGVTVTESIPTSALYQSANSTQGLCVFLVDHVQCLVGSLAPGGSVTVTVEVRPQVEGTITSTATVTGNEADPDTRNNEATEQTSVGSGPDLSLTLSDSPDPVRVNRFLTYTLNVSDLGPVDATSVHVGDTLPKSVKFSSAKSDQGACYARTRTVECNLGEFANGESHTVTIVVRPGRTGTITNQASVSADQPDPDSQNNQATEQTSVGP